MVCDVCNSGSNKGHIHPSKEKACPHAFQAQRSHWPPNVTAS